MAFKILKDTLRRRASASPTVAVRDLSDNERLGILSNDDGDTRDEVQ